MSATVALLLVLAGWLGRQLRWQASRPQARLDAAGVPAVGLVLLCGRPAQALTEYAVAGGYGLVVVGTRGAGLSRRLLGSMAGSLAASTPVPVLLAAGGQATTVQAAGVEGDRASQPRQPAAAESKV